MNSRGRELFSEYAAAHATDGNRRCHAVGIPLIIAAIVLAATRVRLFGPWTLAEPMIAAAFLAQFPLDGPSALVVLVFEVAADLAARLIPGAAPALGAAAGLFALGWIFQFVGHLAFEKNRPAFARNLVHLLVGPLWIAAKTTGRRLT